MKVSDGELLAAKIARDGQWRFPAKDSVPDKFKKCIVYYEDEHFYYHWGFNPVAMFKAFQQNRNAGKVVRGGSTLTQQVIRLSRKNKKRTYFEKDNRNDFSNSFRIASVPKKKSSNYMQLMHLMEEMLLV